MKNLFIVMLILSSVSAFALESTIIMKNAKSSGVCIDNVGGKFTLKVQDGSLGSDIDALVPSSLCEIDSKYKPGKYSEVELVVLGNDTYIKSVKIEETAGIKNLLLSFNENKLKELSATDKKLIEEAAKN